MQISEDVPFDINTCNGKKHKGMSFAVASIHTFCRKVVTIMLVITQT